MSTKATTPNKPRMLRVSDLRRELQSLLLGAEMAHKADIQTYSCGHLSPYALSQTQPHRRRTEEPIWEMSEDREKDEEEGLSPSPFTQRLQRETKMAANIEKMTEAMFDFTVAKGLKPTVLKPGQHESLTDTQRGTKGEEGEERERRKTSLKMVLDTSELFLVKPSIASRTKPPGGVEGNQNRYWFTQSHLGGLTKKDQMRMMRHFDRQVLRKQDLRDRNWISGNKAAEVYEWKLEKELRRLSDQSWPSRDRLGVFSDVFNNVCEGSPVFRDILREIKTDYDLYLNSILDSQTSLEDLSELAPLGGLALVGAEDLEEAGKEVSRLGEEAQRALEENDRVRNQFQNARDRVMEIPEDKGIRKEATRKEATLPGLMRPGEEAVSFIDRVQPKRRQVWIMWEEVQLLQKELKEKMVSIITTGATERCIRDSKGEIMRLLASNERFRNTNKDLESNLNMILNRVKASKDVKAEVWDKIWTALLHEEATTQPLVN
ncbi:uncharacterized protein C6orf118 [Salmo salar]|uniref:Uncharacterized protein C6orf118 n=1 Tax=Salmo salar TaxID=8030 RepID=A0A1S3NDW9_SALSA|nr:uncharacterized protein C6orf118 [Salmo salar]|eukprot:XP_014013435.1 PREDICTED: uncharacterized protein C6orf118 homolog isoform X2 [Salmo salar]